TDVAKAAYAPMGPLTDKFGVGLEASGSYSPNPPSHHNGAHVCGLVVDPETGGVVIDRYFVVDDLGRVLNPMMVRGQSHGGVVQGLGQALLEHRVYDRQSGQLLSGSFMDYGMPRADTMPNVEAELEEVPCKTNPLGVKGIGESGTIGAPPTVINAIVDALEPLGVDHIDMPATPARAWETVTRARAGAAAQCADGGEAVVWRMAFRRDRGDGVRAGLWQRRRGAKGQHRGAHGFEPREPSQPAGLSPERKGVGCLEKAAECLERRHRLQV